MFENRKRNKKIQDFRKDGLKANNYDKIKRTIALESRSGHHIELAFNLVDFDGKRQLAFSGDLITSDGEALARVMKVMWNEELPAEFSTDEILRKQLFGEEAIAKHPEADEESLEADSEAGEHAAADDPNKEPQKPSPIYFRDMAAYVTGMPNEVIVTVKASYRIDNE